MSPRLQALRAASLCTLAAVLVAGCPAPPQPRLMPGTYVVCGGATEHNHAPVGDLKDAHLHKGDVIVIESLNPGKITLAQHGFVPMTLNSSGTAVVGEFSAPHGSQASSGAADEAMRHQVHIVSQASQPGGCTANKKYIRIAFCAPIDVTAPTSSYSCGVSNPSTTSHLGDVHAEN